MGRDLQKRKARSGLPRITQHSQTSQTLRRRIPRDALVSSHWDRTATLTQNYRRLGLAAKLTARPGGVEKEAAASLPVAALPSGRSATVKNLVGTEVRVRRHPQTGAIVEVIRKKQRENPLGDLLLEIEEQDEDAEEPREKREPGGIVRELEEKAKVVAPKRPRKQSQREKEWIERLVAKHGKDFATMARDRRLNPMQQTEADLARRIKKWRVHEGRVGAMA